MEVWRRRLAPQMHTLDPDSPERGRPEGGLLEEKEAFGATPLEGEATASNRVGAASTRSTGTTLNTSLRAARDKERLHAAAWIRLTSFRGVTARTIWGCHH